MAIASSSAYILGQNVTVYRPHWKLAGARSPLVRVTATARAMTAAEGTRPKWPSLYEVLGVQIGATRQEIKSADRRLARFVHPDVAAPDWTALEFVKIHEAYSTLLDSEKRAGYDRMLFGSGLKAMDLRSGTSILAYPTAMRHLSGSGHIRRRTWETDQCW